MKLRQATITNYRAITHLTLPLGPKLTVLFGDNGHGKTSVLSGIAVGLGSIPRLLPKVLGINFRDSDQRGDNPIYIELTADDGDSWVRSRNTGGRNSQAEAGIKKLVDKVVQGDRAKSDFVDLPIVGFYDTDRAVFDLRPGRPPMARDNSSRYTALRGALSARTDFREFLSWFYVRENEELRFQREMRDFRPRLEDLDAVRRAIESLMPGISSPRVRVEPFGFVVTVETEHGQREELSLSQLSGGYRIMVALVADLAWRMSHGNPHHRDPLKSEAIVLIDEIELHLHPSWQQRVLPDLMRTFENAQFIVSTHSPQVLTTVMPEHIVELGRVDGNIVAGSAEGQPTFGAEAGYVQDALMRVPERPSNNDFVRNLMQYRNLISDGMGESAEAVELRRKLDEQSPLDPGLDRADMEMRRQKILNSFEGS
jgi:predicted ATP-binding protein involved in virulence